jgi:hypothetical protein
MKLTLTDCLVLSVAALVIATAATAASAQPLADVAKKEKDRRQTLAEKPEKAKVYTNDNLGGAGRLTTGTAMPAAAPASAATPAGQPGQPGSAEPGGQPGSTSPSGEQRDEQYWRKRITAARDALKRNELMAAALQNRVDGLWADFTSRDDPAQRAVVEQQRQEAMAEQQRINTEVERLKKEITDIEEEARRARVPPGWLR